MAIREHYTHVPRDLAMKLRDQYKTRVFVETGTYKGQTTLWADEHFDRVYTIELSDDLFESFNENIRSLAINGNIVSCRGDSRDVLRHTDLQNLIQTTLCFFWLDAHWFHLDTVAGEREDVPLLEELQIILETGLPHVILIDDAPLIAKALKDRDENYRTWPTYDQIEPLIRDRYKAYYTGNVLVLEPKEGL